MHEIEYVQTRVLLDIGNSNIIPFLLQRGLSVIPSSFSSREQTFVLYSRAWLCHHISDSLTPSTVMCSSFMQSRCFIILVYLIQKHCSQVKIRCEIDKKPKYTNLHKNKLGRIIDLLNHIKTSNTLLLRTCTSVRKRGLLHTLN